MAKALSKSQLIAAIAEKAEALDGIGRRSLSVLTGGAGTGKTSVVKVLLDGLHNGLSDASGCADSGHQVRSGLLA